MEDSKKSACCIEDLPQELLINIFSILPIEDIMKGVRSTCTRWNALSRERALWTRLEFTKESQNVFTNEEIIDIMFAVSNFVEELVLDDFQFDNILNSPLFLDFQLCMINVKKLHVICPNNFMLLILLHTILKNFPLLEVFECDFSNVDFLMQSDIVSMWDLSRLKRLCIRRSDGVQANVNSIDVKLGEGENTLMEEIVFEECRRLDITDMSVENILTKCKNLRTLVVDNSGYVSNTAFEFLTTPTLLTRLGIADTMVDDNGMKHIATIMPHLRELSIDACKYITDVGLGHIAEKCPHLETICISKYSGEYRDKLGSNITDGGLQQLALNCPGMKRISMAHSLQVSDRGIVALAESCKDLISIDIRGCTSLTDVSMIALADNCQKVQEVLASECVHITSKSINAILLNCGRIHTLHASTCHFISKIDLDAFEKKTNRYKQFFLCTCSEMDKNVVNREDTKTSRLGMDDVMKDNVAEDNLANGILEGNVFVDVNVAGVSVADGNVHVGKGTDDRNEEKEAKDNVERNNINVVSMEHLICKCCRLSEGRRNFLNSISSSNVPTFRQCSSVRDLELDFCSKLDDASALQLANYCPDLRHLNLNGCFKITDAGIDHIARNCKLLNSLAVSNLSTLQNSRLTDASLTSLAKHCLNLRVLYLEKITNITTKGIENLLVNSGSLKEMHVTHGDNLSKSDLNGLAEKFSNCGKSLLWNP